MIIAKPYLVQLQGRLRDIADQVVEKLEDEGPNRSLSRWLNSATILHKYNRHRVLQSPLIKENTAIVIWPTACLTLGSAQRTTVKRKEITMNSKGKATSLRTLAVTTTALLLTAGLASAQDYARPAYSPDQLNNLVSRIALYPDPLLAQVLAAATFPDQIADAASFADANRNLTGPDLADAMTAANLPFDPSVQALIPFPTVLDMMASDMNWTSDLGNAVLAERSDVMDAVQQMRHTAANYGYLNSNAQERVVPQEGAIEILPANPNYVYVPVYDPYIVYAAPRPGFFVAGAIRFPFGFGVGTAFGGWGWGGGFYWPSHTVMVHNEVWGRTWVNRGVYVHNYGNWNNGRWASTAVNRNVTVNNRNVWVNNNVNTSRNTMVYRPPERKMQIERQPIENRPFMNPQQFNTPRNTPVYRPPERNMQIERQPIESRQSVNPQQFNRQGYERQNFNRPAPEVHPAYNPPTFQRYTMERPAPQQPHFTPQPRGANNFGHR